jgi:hypothetical protein
MFDYFCVSACGARGVIFGPVVMAVLWAVAAWWVHRSSHSLTADRVGGGDIQRLSAVRHSLSGLARSSPLSFSVMSHVCGRCHQGRHRGAGQSPAG